MALNTSPSKRFYKAALKQASEWGTAVEVGAGDELIVTSDGDPGLRQTYASCDAIGQVMPFDGDLSAYEPIEFAPEFGSKCGLQYAPGPIGSAIAGLFGEVDEPQPLFVVDATNNKIDLKEGAGEPLVATVASGSYTAATLCAAIKAALEVPGALTFTVTFSTTTLKFTIAADGEFSLLWNTGANKLVDISTMCGFSDAADDTGAATYTADTVAIGVAYVHRFSWADEMPADAFFTFVTSRPGAVWEIPSCICNKLELKVGDGKVQGSIGLVGNQLVNDSVINDEDSLAALTPEVSGTFIKFQHGVARFNAESGDALDGDDAVEVSDFTIAYERTTDAQMSLGGSYISQPKESNFKIGPKLTLPYATAANVAYLDLFTGMTAQKMDIVFTGPTIAGTHCYGLTLGFPRLKLVAPPDVKLEDIIRNGLEFVAEEAAAAPTGMTEVRPYIEITNTRSTAYLTVA